MITLYHGSYVKIEKPDVKFGRKNLDFGPGFYVTNIHEQASSWAKIIASRKGRFTKPFVSIYKFNVSDAIKEGVRIKRFDEYNIEWLEYVVSCRKGKDISNEYDIVEGGVANDNVIDTVEDFEKNLITAEQALGQLKYKKVNHQMCILNQSVIDKYFTFVDSEEMLVED